MIRLTCTKCKETLEMDEAFAGGVCRCQHCGTIQTVPSHLKASGRPATPAAAASKALYQSPGGGPGPVAAPSSGLDDLADVVASSGLSRGALTRPGPNGSAPYGGQGAAVGYQSPYLGQRKNNTTLIVVLVAAVVLAAIGGTVVYLLLRPAPTVAPAPTPAGGGGSTVAGGGPSGGTTGGGGTETVAMSGPHFATLPITGSRVVFVLDRGSGMTGGLVDRQRAALNNSIKSLGAGKEFAVIFWKRTEDPNLDAISFPTVGLAKATPEQAQKCFDKFQDLTASGATDFQDSLKAAVARNPDAIIIATPKGDIQISALATAVDQALGGRQIKFSTVSYGGTNPILKGIAEKTGGTYVEATVSELGNQ